VARVRSCKSYNSRKLGGETYHRVWRVFKDCITDLKMNHTIFCCFIGRPMFVQAELEAVLASKLSNRGPSCVKVAFV
jgi:hypothetical protein